MFISKKRFKALEDRIAELERRSDVFTYEFGRVDFPQYAKKMPKYIRKEIKTAIDKNNSRLGNKEN